MRKLYCTGISIMLVCLLAASGSISLAGGGMSKKNRRTKAGVASIEEDARRREELKQLEARAESAERRAQDAEASADRAANDARAAREQAAQAMEAARHANEALTSMRETIGRLEQNDGRRTQDVASLVKADEGIVADLSAERTAQKATAQKVETVDKRTEGAVTSNAKLPIRIYGSFLLNAGFVDGGANTNDIPLFGLRRDVTPDQNHQNFNLTGRQSRFGLRYEAGIFNEARLAGVFEFDLLGGKPAFANGVDFDLFRLRLAYGRIDWKEDSVEAGQDWAVFSPLNPTTLASYAIPGFSTSGNLWNRIPQIRYEHREGAKSKFILTTALLDPNAGDNPGNNAARTVGLGERGSLPAFETRLGVTTPSHGKESSFGLSGHYSRLLGVPGSPAGTTVRSPIDSYGVSGDVNAWLTSGIRISGEAFHGRALGIFSGNVAQSAVVIGGRTRGINSTGGWAELHAEAPTGYEGSWKKLSANFGFGIEDNRGRDLILGLRDRNRTYMVNGQYRYSPNFTVALEYRRILTDYFRLRAANQQLNWVNLAFLYSF